MVAYADNVKCVVFKLVLDEFEVLTMVFESAISGLKTLSVDRIRKRHRYFQFDDLVFIIKVGLDAGRKSLITLKAKTPKYNIVTAYIEEEHR